MPKVKWSGEKTIVANMDNYKDKIRVAARVIAAYIAVRMENFAQLYASWQDQTGNARQGLNSFIEEISDDIVRIYLAHGVEYGIYLETKYAGRYAIIWPTISAHLEVVAGLLKEIFEAA